MSEVKTDSVVNVSGDNDSGIDLSTNDVVAIKTADTERMRVTSDGQGGVAIGGTDPDPTSDGTSTRAFLAVQGSGNRGCLALGTTSNSGGDVAALRFNNGSNVVASIGVDSDSGSTSAGAMNFFTNATQRMKITSGGLVGLGTSNPSILFEVAGNVDSNYIGSFHNDGNNANRYVLRLAGGSDSGSGTSYLVGLQDGDFNSVGSITHSGGNASFNTSSDHRLKENVVDMTGAIDRVKSLAPKRFNFIRTPDITVDGFIAHEAQAVVPGAVSGTHNEVDDDSNPVYQGIDHSKLVPLLVGALKESIAKIETLETEMTALKARVTALEDA